jgi:putative phosphoesterase
LEEFQETYTLTFAVSGEDDSEDVKRYLDEKRVVRFGQRRVGMLHGHQFEAEPSSTLGRLRRLLGRRADPVTLPDFLIGQFADEDVHAILFGHTHCPYVRMHDGVLLFNPGSALPGPDLQPSVGILDVGERSITGRIAYL